MHGNIGNHFGKFEIRNREFAAQLKDFSGLRIGSSRPSDNDMFWDWKDNAYIFAEIKFAKKRFNPKDPESGQMKALRRLNDDLVKLKPCLLVRAEHCTPCDKPIDVANCLVTAYRSVTGEWEYPQNPIKTKSGDFIPTVKLITDSFLRQYGEGYKVKPSILDRIIKALPKLTIYERIQLREII